MTDSTFNLTDIPLKPKGRDGTDLQTGCLVVRGGKLSEAEFNRLYGGDQRKVEQAGITFEDEDGNVQTSSPQRDA